jgi:dTDP-4-amino-4,6-dideoxygalactose transaminase
VSGVDIIWTPSDRHNYSYFPVLIRPDFPLSRDELYSRFREHDILVRRYFYPLISTFPMYRGLDSAKPDRLSVATSLSSQILCLPIFDSLTDEAFASIIDVIVAASNEK